MKGNNEEQKKKKVRKTIDHSKEKKRKYTYVQGYIWKGKCCSFALV